MTILVLLIALLLRLPQLNSSWWLDEAAQLMESSRPLSQQWQIAKDFHPPLYHYLVHILVQFSSTEWWLRGLASLLPAIITIWLSIKIMKSLKLANFGWWTGWWLATNSFFIFYAQELRPYSLSVMWAVLSWWALLKITISSTNKTSLSAKPQTKSLVFFALATLAGWWTLYLFPFVTVSQLAYLFWLKFTQKGKLNLTQILTFTLTPLASFIFWLPMFQQQLIVGNSWQKDLVGWKAVVGFTPLKSLILTLGKLIFGVSDLAMSWPYLLSIFVLLALLFATVWVNRQQLRKIQISNLALVFWLNLPLFLAIAVSLVLPILQPKRVLFLWPFFAISLPIIFNQIVFIATRQHQKLTSNLLNIVLCILLTVNIISLKNYYWNPHLQRENWRELHQTIVKKYPLGSAVMVFAFDEPFAPWRIYDEGKYPTVSLGLPLGSYEQVADKLKDATQYRQILVFDYLRDITDPNKQIESVLSSYGYKEVEVIDFPIIGFIRVFMKGESLLSSALCT